ncbi:hypothetical protein ISR92_02880 [Patescibacteria group bacterium]|nr:hypothetical protein [Patescibacteria group bacterium]
MEVMGMIRKMLHYARLLVTDKKDFEPFVARLELRLREYTRGNAEWNYVKHQLELDAKSITTESNFKVYFPKFAVALEQMNSLQ